MPRVPPPDLPLPHRHDVLIALSGLVGGAALWFSGVFHSYTPDPEGVLRQPAWSLVPLLVMCGAAVLRRVAQPWALYLATAALVADFVIGSLLATVLLFTDVVYAAVVYGSARVARRVPVVSLFSTIVVTFAAAVAWATAGALAVGVVTALVTVGPAFTGVVVRNHRDRAAAERLRAEQAVLLAEMDRAQAVGAERARMARELHDLVANHLSAIAIHATAAQSLEHDRDAVRDALGVIRENSVQGLTEMRRLIGILRDTAGVTEPDATPTLDGLDALLDRARTSAAGRFRFALHDERGGDGLPAPVELAAYRIVQESVTNALKHAAPGAVTIRLEGGDILSVDVTSPLGAVSDGAGPRAPGSGAGLVGMRERVELLGGSLTAGPAVADGGGAVWRVRAELPAGGEGFE